MKNLRLVIVLMATILFAMPSLKAQDSSLGVRAGWQSALLSYDGETTDALSSFYAGVFKERKIVPLLHYGYGLEFAQMGGKDKDMDLEYKLGYIGVPVYAKAKVGPVYGLLGSGINVKISETDDVYQDKAKGIDVPVYAGVGLNFLMLSIEARYHWGLMEVQDQTKNQYLQIGLGLSF